MSIYNEIDLFQEAGKPELGFPNHEFIQLWARTSARRARVLPITVWTSGWENQFQFSNFLEEALSGISLITWLWSIFEISAFGLQCNSGETKILVLFIIWIIIKYEKHQEFFIFPGLYKGPLILICWIISVERPTNFDWRFMLIGCLGLPLF